MMARTFGGTILALVLLSGSWPSPVDAHVDLDLRDVDVHRVSGCVNELRFKVKYRLIPSLTHGHVGPDPGASYNVAVNARTASGEVLLRSLPVDGQPLGGTVSFTVPDGARICRDAASSLQRYETIVIHVDSGRAIEESNENNNVRVKHWRPPHRGPFSLPGCYVSASFDPPACQ